ncbi:tetratricopeptide repeat protein [Marinicauda algicola]|uniref:Tetratricopeptide repeat protein n=1 Tax=Marinicauda algicola TaxID=2029849 RepID=A0A4S2GW28_9PROT|nr:tetratricopeptide repeat protein [Marinicauda algicola]TGY87223.1 tetratricopeptide repeat protein [Marinicauda algicola]
MRALILTSASLVLAASCAAGTGFLSGPEEEPTVYGAFLAGRYASVARDVDRSADFYAQALEIEPGLDILSERAFYAALMAGDFARADEAARQAVEQSSDLEFARIYARAAALEEGLRLTAQGESEVGPFGRVIEDMLADWELARTRSGARQAAGQTLEIPSQAAPYAIVHKALIFEAAGEWSRAEDAYTAASQDGDLADFVTVLHGSFLERRGRRAEAIALYQARISSDDNPDPDVTAALARAREGRRPSRLTPAEGAARSLYALSRMLVQSAPGDYTALFLRLVQRLDPDLARNRYTLAQTLEALGLVEEAIALYDGLAGTPYGVDARVDAAWLLFVAGEREQAMERAETLRDETMDASARLLLADIYRLTGRCARAVEIYDGVMQGGAEARWQPHYYKGICHQTLGDWPAAEFHFLRALEIAPNEPRLLNHLGYNWIVFGERVEEGLTMVRRAAALAPDNGAILDSVGWGLFKLGRYEEAVDWLERAVEQSPGDPTINWHLGDAYARTGRDLQARFQWEHALGLDPDAREEALIRERLERGLEAARADLE